MCEEPGHLDIGDRDVIYCQRPWMQWADIREDGCESWAECWFPLCMTVLLMQTYLRRSFPFVFFSDAGFIMK